MKKNKLTPVWIIFAFLIIGLAIVVFTGEGNGNGAEGPGPLDDFAKCLASKNITMYGAEWCSHCQEEKKGFGNSFQYVPYVECTVQVQKCVQDGIEAYPTWIFPEGKKLVGQQGIQRLSEESGCSLPSTEKPE